MRRAPADVLPQMTLAPCQSSHGAPRQTREHRLDACAWERQPRHDRAGIPLWTAVVPDHSLAQKSPTYCRARRLPKTAVVGSRRSARRLFYAISCCVYCGYCPHYPLGPITAESLGFVHRHFTLDTANLCTVADKELNLPLQNDFSFHT